MSEKPGRKTDLTRELLKQIKESILDGNDLKTTAKVCGINEGTFYVWHSDNYLRIADKIEGWKRDRKVILASNNVEELLQISDNQNRKYVNKKGTEVTIEGRDSQLTRVKADMSKFVLETLDKENYSKRSELTGKDGDSLIPNKEEKKKSTEAIKQYLNDNKKEDNSTNTGE